MPRSKFLIRHGQSTFNALYEDTGVDPLHFDARLSSKGRQQVAALRDAASQLDVDIVVVSPLTRAIETGLGLFDVEETEFFVSPLHRERLANSCDVGRHPRELAADFPMLNFDHLPDRWWYDGDEDWRGVAIEPSCVLTQRIAHFSEWVSALPKERIAVIGHGTFFRQLTGRHFENCEIVHW